MLCGDQLARLEREQVCKHQMTVLLGVSAYPWLILRYFNVQKGLWRKNQTHVVFKLLYCFISNTQFPSNPFIRSPQPSTLCSANKHLATVNMHRALLWASADRYKIQWALTPWENVSGENRRETGRSNHRQHIWKSLGFMFTGHWDLQSAQHCHPAATWHLVHS